jgi:uncharacterized membrane protein
MRVKSGLKSSFIAGLALLAPVVLTVFIVNTVANWILGALAPVVQETRFEQITGDFLLAQVAVGVIAVGLVIVIGFVAQYSVGRRMFGRAGRVMNFIPVVRTIYSSIRQVASSVSNRATDFKSVVLVEYPREGAYSLGLVTAESPPAAERIAGEPVYNVFFPSSPNPTGGKLVMVPADQVYETDMSVRRGIQILMTTGMAEDESAIELSEEETLAEATEGVPNARHVDDLVAEEDEEDDEDDEDHETTDRADE